MGAAVSGLLLVAEPAAARDGGAAGALPAAQPGPGGVLPATAGALPLLLDAAGAHDRAETGDGWSEPRAEPWCSRGVGAVIIGGLRGILFAFLLIMIAYCLVCHRLPLLAQSSASSRNNLCYVLNLQCVVIINIA